LRYYPTNANADTACDSSAVPKDLIRSLGSGNIDMTASSASFTERGSADLDVSVEEKGYQPLSIPTSVDVSLLSDGEVRYRLQAVDAACAVLASSPYSATISGVGINVQTLALDWPANARRLRLSLEVRRITSAASVRVRCGTNSYLDAVWKSRLSQIVEAVLARLPGITTAAGYHFTVGTVALGRMDYSQIDTPPGVLVWGRNINARAAALLGDGPNGREVMAEIILRLITVGTDDPQGDLLLLAEDVTHVLEKDPQHLGFQWARIARTETFEEGWTDDEIAKPAGIGHIRFGVTYRCMRGHI